MKALNLHSYVKTGLVLFSSYMLILMTLVLIFHK